MVNLQFARPDQARYCVKNRGQQHQAVAKQAMVRCGMEIMKPTITFEAPQGLDPKQLKRQARKEARGRGTARKTQARPRVLLFAGLASLAWLAALGGYGYVQAWQPAWQDPQSLAPLMTLALAPLLLIWLIAASVNRRSLFQDDREKLKHDLNYVFSPVDAAEAKVKLTLARFSNSLEQLDVAASGATDRVGRLESQLKEEIVNLFAATADADARAIALRDSLRRETQTLASVNQELAQRVERLEQQFAAVHARVEDGTAKAERAVAQGTEALQAGCTRLNENSAALEARLEELAGKVASTESGAEAMVTTLETRLTGLCETLTGRMSDLDQQARALDAFCAGLGGRLTRTAEDMAAAAQTAATAVTGLGNNLDEKGAALTRQAEDAIAQARAAADALVAQLAGARRAMAGTLQAAEADIDAFTADLDARLAAVPDRVDAALDAAVVPLANAQTVLQSQMTALAEAAGSVEQRLGSHHETLRETAGRQADAVAALESRLTQQIGALDMAARDTLERLSHAGTQIDTRTEQLNTVSQALTDQLKQQETGLGAQADRLRGLVETAGQSFQQMAARADEAVALLAASDADLKRHLAALGEVHTGAGQIYEGQRQAMAAHRAALEQDLSAGHARLDSLIASLAEQQAKLAEGAGNGADRLTDLSARVAHQVAALDQAREQVASRLSTTAAELAESTAGLTQATDHLVGEAETVALRLQDRLTRTVSRGVQASGQALDQLADIYRARFARLSDETNQHFAGASDALIAAAKRTEAAGEALSQSLAKRSDDLSQTAEQLDGRLRRMQESIAQAMRTPFLECSQKILERLASDSIDVGKALSEDIPDDAWARFLKGDKSRFARQVNKLGAGRLRDRARQLYSQDADFKAAATRFMADFDTMMGQAMAEDGRNALAVTLISSDLGRLYVALTQAVRRPH